ncbi:MAG: hypothetical protein Q9162_006987 [Coniocarpon cinnabarinum]
MNSFHFAPLAAQDINIPRHDVNDYGDYLLQQSYLYSVPPTPYFEDQTYTYTPFRPSHSHSHSYSEGQAPPIPPRSSRRNHTSLPPLRTAFPHPVLARVGNRHSDTQSSIHEAVSPSSDYTACPLDSEMMQGFGGESPTTPIMKGTLNTALISDSFNVPANPFIEDQFSFKEGPHSPSPEYSPFSATGQTPVALPAVTHTQDPDVRNHRYVSIHPTQRGPWAIPPPAGPPPTKPLPPLPTQEPTQVPTQCPMQKPAAEQTDVSMWRQKMTSHRAGPTDLPCAPPAPLEVKKMKSLPQIAKRGGMTMKEVRDFMRCD